eukprot:scaffold14022_cov108-Isochrysis_galbana.AAC.15
MIGETIDGADEICGARVVDKSVGNRCTYRLELWFRKNDEKIANELLGACSCLVPPMPCVLAVPVSRGSMHASCCRCQACTTDCQVLP